jgi:hypothetical protein
MYWTDTCRYPVSANWLRRRWAFAGGDGRTGGARWLARWHTAHHIPTGPRHDGRESGGHFQIFSSSLNIINSTLCALGWVDFDEKIILNTSTPGIYSFLCKSTENWRKTFLGHYWLEERSWPFGQVPNEGWKEIFRTQPCYTSKDAEFCVDFKNINLP